MIALAVIPECHVNVGTSLKNGAGIGIGKLENGDTKRDPYLIFEE